MKVSRLPKDPGPPGWNCILPEPAPAEPLEDNRTADWLVIGAGFAGLSAARRLTQNCSGDRVVVLEASRLAEGPAGRNSGFMIDLPHDLASDDYGGALEADMIRTQDNRLAIEFARQMAKDFDIPEGAFSECGKINAAATDRGERLNHDYAGHLQKMGERHEIYDAQTMREITGIDYYQAGLFTPGTVVLQPAQYIRGIADGLRSEGVEIFENSPVIALEPIGGSWRAKTPGGQVTASSVILAVNGHLNSFGHLPGRLMHIFTYASMSRAMTEDEIARIGGSPDWGVTPADPLGSTVRRISGIGGDRMVVRNRFTFDPSLEVSDHRIARVAQDHDRAFSERFPMLKDVEMEYRWGGRLCLSLNNVQHVRQLDEGLFSASVQNGLGTTKGTLAGLAAVDLATNRVSDTAERLKNAPLPRRLPPGPIAKIGATLRMRWGEWRADREL